MSGAACGSCLGQCCYNALIRLSGDDIRRIARSQRLGYETFVDVIRDDGRTDDEFALAFALGAAGSRHLLTLRHSARISGACTFLLLLGNHQPCGIYADRPMVCRVYPMRRVPTGLAVRDDVICRPDYWNTPVVDDPVWLDHVRQRDAEWHIYERVVRAYNTAAAANSLSDAQHYLAFLDAAYDRIEAQRAGAPADGELAQATVDALVEDALTATA